MTATFTTTPSASAAPRTPGEVQIATLSKRSAAVLLDSCITMAIGFLVLAPVWLINGGGPSTTDGMFHVPTDESTPTDLLRAAVEYLVFPIVWTIYAGLLTSQRGPWNGQTVGKRAAQLRIVTASGGPLDRGTAWRRVLWSTALLGLIATSGQLVDAAFDSAPTASDITAWIAAAVGAAAVLVTLRGEVRQTGYDLLAGTVVVGVPDHAAEGGVEAGEADADRAPEPAPAGHGADPHAPPTFAQAAGAGGGVRVLPRRRRGWTWAGVPLLALLLLTTPLLSKLEPPEDRSKEILALPETKQALARVRTLETLATACLASGGGAEACDEASELRAPDDLEFSEDFDLTTDPVGAHAGRVAVVADGDDTLMIYGFTSADRVWASVVEDGDTEHVCFKATSDDLCDGVWAW